MLESDQCELQVLKALTTNKRRALDFLDAYNENLFSKEYYLFAKSILSFAKAYKEVPSRKVLESRFKERQDIVDNFLNVWSVLDSVDYSDSDFGFYLDQLKNKYSNRVINNLRNSLSNTNLSDTSLNHDKIIKSLQSEIVNLKEIRKGKKKVFKQETLKAYMPRFKREYFQKASEEEKGRGILTGYSFLDYIKNGICPGEMVIVAAETGGGKAQPLDTLIPTPSGFKLLEDVAPGDYVFGRDGKPCLVEGESQIYNDPGWKFIFNDGTEVIAHDNHEWLSFDKNEQLSLSRKRISFDSGGTIRTSAEIARTIKKGGRNNHAIPLAEPLSLPHKDLLIDPYVLGLWLGDGHALDARLTTADVECKDAFVKAGYEHSKTYENGGLAKTYSFLHMKAQLNSLDLIGNKHIPNDYLWASYEQRMSLIQGLMDSDGTASKSGNLSFNNSNRAIIDGICHLIASMGESYRIRQRNSKYDGKITGINWTVSFTPRFNAFRLERKLNRQKLAKNRLNRFRYIVEARRIEAVPMKCIQVSSNDHLYLTGINFVPTHNSMFLNNMAIQMWMQQNTIYTDSENFGKGYNCLYFSLEMPYEACARRTMSRLADVPIYGLRDCKLNQLQADSLSQAVRFIDRYPYEFQIIDVPRGASVEEIERRYQEACDSFQPDFVVVDYLGLLEDREFSGDDWLKLGYIAGKVHEFGRVHNIATLTAVQLNRPQNKGKKDSSDLIGLHRIGRSSLIMHHANIGIQIETRKNEYRYSDLIYHIIKNRDGELGRHVLKKNFKNASISEMEEPYRPENFENGPAGDNGAIDISDYLKKIGWHES